MSDDVRDPQSAFDPQTGGVALAITLAAVTGFVDGVGVSYIAGVFVSFMSGNTTGAAVAFAAGEWTAFLRIGVAVPLYLLAVTIGALLFAHRPRMRPILFAAVAVLLAGFALVARILPVPADSSFTPSEVLLLALLVLPMGVLTMTLRRVGGATIGLGYVTGTLVGLGERLAVLITRRRRSDWGPVGLFAGMWTCFFVGAAAGAASVSLWGSFTVAAPILVLAAVCAGDLRGHRRAARRARADTEADTEADTAAADTAG